MTQFRVFFFLLIILLPRRICLYFLIPNTNTPTFTDVCARRLSVSSVRSSPERGAAPPTNQNPRARLLIARHYARPPCKNGISRTCCVRSPHMPIGILRVYFIFIFFYTRVRVRRNAVYRNRYRPDKIVTY